jgi:hypothetical protein
MGKAYNTFYGCWGVLSLYMMHGSCQSGPAGLPGMTGSFANKTNCIIYLSRRTLCSQGDVRSRNSRVTGSGTVVPHCGCFVRVSTGVSKAVNTQIRTAS